MARLAGGPTSVVTRARSRLARLEAGQGPTPRPSDAPTPQLSLFPAPGERFRREIAGLEPERMTPLDALTLLARLVEQARERPGDG